MTKAQTKSHKQGNQNRKAALIAAAKLTPKGLRRPDFGMIQDGKYTK